MDNIDRNINRNPQSGSVHRTRFVKKGRQKAPQYTVDDFHNTGFRHVKKSNWVSITIGMYCHAYECTVYDVHCTPRLKALHGVQH